LEKDLDDLGKRLVVKRTFLQIETDHLADDQMLGARRRSRRAFTEPCKKSDFSEDVSLCVKSCDIQSQLHRDVSESSSLEKFEKPNTPVTADATPEESSETANRDAICITSMYLPYLEKREMKAEGEGENFLNAFPSRSFKKKLSTGRASHVPAPKSGQSQSADGNCRVPATECVHNTSLRPSRERTLTMADRLRSRQASTSMAWKTSHQFRTTLMLKNIPNDYTRDMFLDILDSNGFRGCYDFVYLPVDSNRRVGLGYVFVNCVSSSDAEQMRRSLQGFLHWRVPSHKVCEVCWGEPLQGLQAHIDRYRNSHAKNCM
jgi:hypothetical protein